MFLILFLISSLLFSQTASLKCYSCSTLVGDRYCTEDNFDPEHVSVLDCPADSDICLRAIQLSDGSREGRAAMLLPTAGSMFRACGTSELAQRRELTSLGVYPIKNSCVVKRIGDNVPYFNNSVFQICSCSGDLSNGRGEMKCTESINLSARSINNRL